MHGWDWQETATEQMMNELYLVYTIEQTEQTSNKHQAGLMEPRPWFKYRPRLSPQLITCHNYRPSN